jgi:peptidoglycan hydrolase-like protein with peptidoglycan-binding domain
MTAAARHRTLPRAAALLGALLASLLLASLLLAAGPLAVPASAKRHRAVSLRIAFVRCSSVPFPCASHTIVTRTGRLLVGARGIGRRARIEFPVRPKGRKAGRRAVAGTLRTATRIVVRVPGDAVSGRIRVVMPGGKRSNYARIVVTRPPAPPGGTPYLPGGGPSVFDGNGMWIWYLSKSQGGDPAQIAAQAQAHGVHTIFVKSADGAGVWSQFSAATVAALKATGLRVCGWQFVYGSDPGGEAAAGAAAATAGADCLVIDAEGAYESKYAQAQQYMTALRQQVGPVFPVGLTSFPYVDFHPGLPYSVFMAPGNATFNLPQVYWKTIGDSVDASLAHTYEWNVPYQAPIFPLGQTYDNPSASDVVRFRQLSAAYGARGLSWWDWQETSAGGWDAVGAPFAAPAVAAVPAWPTLKAGAGGKAGSKGDLVVWAQEHLVGAGHPLTVDGKYGGSTATALSAFQAGAGLPQTGVLDAATWPALLRATPVAPDWTAPKSTGGSGGAGGATTAAVRSGADAPKGPASAALKARRDEVPPGPSSAP